MQYQPLGDNKKETRENVVKIFAIVGLVIVLVAAGFIGIQAMKKIPTALSAVSGAFGNITFSSNNKEDIVLAASPSSIETGNDITLAWVHNDKDRDGSYTFSYDCSAGVQVARVTDDSEENIFCNVPLNFVNTNNELELNATSDFLYETETLLRINFTENGESEVSAYGTFPLEITNQEFAPEADGDTEPIGPEQNENNDGSVEGVTFTPTSGGRTTEIFSGPTVPSVPFSNPNGTPDLIVSILAVGSVDSSGNFTEKDSIDRDDDRSAVKFVVTNVGTKETGSWKFNAKLPTRPSKTFRSPSQTSLFPTENIEFIIGFDRVKRDTSVTFSIELDPGDLIDELNESNNTAGKTIDVII